MFGFDPMKVIEDFMRTKKADKVIAEIIGGKIEIETHKEGNTVSFSMSYGGHPVSTSSIDITPEE